MKSSLLHYWYHQQQSRDMALKIPQYLPSDLIVDPKIVLNVSSHQAVTDKRKLIPIVVALEIITGQNGLLTQAKCSLSTWRLKQGMEIGVKITLNGKKMWNFLDQLIHIILPNLIYFKKFNGSSYDRWGNLAFGLQNLEVFPEIEWLRESQHLLSKWGSITGVDITLVWNILPHLHSSNRDFFLTLFEKNNWKSCQTTNFQLFL